MATCQSITWGRSPRKRGYGLHLQMLTRGLSLGARITARKWVLIITERPELSHARPAMSTAKAELETPSRVACSDWLGHMAMSPQYNRPNNKDNTGDYKYRQYPVQKTIAHIVDLANNKCRDKHRRNREPTFPNLHSARCNECGNQKTKRGAPKPWLLNQPPSKNPCSSAE